jgi:hypothetical protein
MASSLSLRRSTQAAAFVLALAVLAACSAATATPTATPIPSATLAATPSPTPVPTPTPMPTPSPTINVPALAQQYLALATQINSNEDALWKKYGKQKTLAQQHALFGGQAAAEQVFMDGIRGLVFPDSMQSDVHDLLKALAEQQLLDLELSKTKTWSAAEALYKADDAASTAASSASNLLRGDLGLPPVPVS